MRVMAVSAPHWVSKVGVSNVHSFNSKTPFSLQNALRDCIDKAINGIGIWSKSNLAEKDNRKKAVLLLEYWEEEQIYFRERFIEISPDILFIGAMTLSLPSAIAIATEAKKLKGEKVFVVIGGKHCNETVQKHENHFSSPLFLMAEQKIPPVFDLVFSGDGEKAITTIGEIIGTIKTQKDSFETFHFYKEKFEISKGNWIAGQFINGNMIYYEGKGGKIDYSTLAFPTQQFPLGRGFSVFKTDFTAHAYSDMSKGCVYNCFFCSEKSSINGKVDANSFVPVERLSKQFMEVQELKEGQYRLSSVSIFVEDSIFLGGFPVLIRQFCTVLSSQKVNIPFGCQFTIDTFNSNFEKGNIGLLKEVGLSYVALGIETIEEDIALKFSKNTNRKESWVIKTENVIASCKKLGLKVGMFLLWGLGESQLSRIKQLNRIRCWVKEYNIQIEVGLNLATLHPLAPKNKNNTYTYIDWGTNKDSLYLPYFVKLFGEASVLYKNDTSNNFPSISDLEEIQELYLDLENAKTKLYLDND